MIATFVNCLTVIAGTFLGLLFHKRIKEDFKGIVFTGTGIISLIIGLEMSLETTKILYAAFSLVAGGFVGYYLKIEDRIFQLGERISKSVSKNKTRKEGSKDFASGFLTASVIFCVGAMTIVGSLKAGISKDYELILTKSVMDGFMSIMLAAAMGIGVGFSAIVILVYQGGLTLLASTLAPIITPLVESELTGVGGMLVLMIGLNLLRLTTIKTANYIPAIFIALFLAAVDPYLQPILETLKGAF